MAPRTSENSREINTGKWIKLVKDIDNDELIVEQGPKTTFEDAIGMLHSAIVRYETKNKIELEFKNLDLLKKMTDEITNKLSEMAGHAHLIENATMKMAAASQTILRSK